MSLLRRLRGLLVAYYAHMTEYRAELLLWALANSLSFILMGAWYEATSRGAFAFQPIEIVRYFLAVFVMRQVTVVWVIWELEQDVLHGRMTHMLAQPIDPAWRYLCMHLSERLARLPFSFGLVVLFFALYPPAFFVPDAADAALAAVFAVIAFLLRFLLQYTFAFFSFWTERASAIESLVFIVFMFLSGSIAPLDVFPAAVRDAVLLTPFPYIIWVPARLLVGGAAVDVGQALLVCGAWLVALFVANRLLWRRALRRHAAMGG